MAKADSRLRVDSNKGRKMHAKFNKVVIFCDTYVEMFPNNEGTLPTRDQVFNYGCKIGLPSDMLGAIISCFYHAHGDRIADEGQIEDDIDKVENRFFTAPAKA